MVSCVGEANCKRERKTVEKFRRMHMKSLCLKLSSIIPKEHRSIHKVCRHTPLLPASPTSHALDVLTQQDNLDQATCYIKILRERIEKLKQRRRVMDTGGRDGNEMAMGIRLPILEVRHKDLNLEVLLISGLSKKFMFHEVINVLEEEGAEVVNASFSVVGDKIFHTIHSQAVSSRIGVEVSRVYKRLEELVN